jgi:DamX protein
MIADARSDGYFETPERSERQQLLLHLVRNAGEVIYLRGPDGAGKTLFARRMFEQLGESLYGAWIVAGKEPDFVAAVNRQLSVATDSASPWPDSLIFALGEREMLLVVDDADAVDAQTLSHIAALRQRGGHVLMIGRGGLPPGAVLSPQFIDLPGFAPQQSAAFLRSRSTAAASTISDDVADALHRAAQGMPGPLLDALQVLTAKRPAGATTASMPDRGRKPFWPWYLLAGAVVLLLGTVLLFQDSINDAVAPAEVAAPGSPGADGASKAGRAETGGQLPAPLPPFEPARSDAAVVQVAPIALPAADSAAPTPVVPGPEPGIATNEDIDPLEAVMQDALAAVREADPKPSPTASEAGVSSGGQATKRSAPPKPNASAAATAVAGSAQGEPAREAQADATAAAPPVVSAVDSGKPEAAVATDEVAERPTPAPVEDRGAPAAVAATPTPSADGLSSQPQPAPVVDRTRQQPTPAPAAVAGNSWLESRKPSHYTLQLVGARDRASIEKFIRRHGIRPPYAVFERNLKGAPWYSLVAGEYPDRAAAVAARAALPDGLERSGVWPRTFESIYKLIQQ